MHLRAVGPPVVDPGAVAMTLIDVPVVGEPEPAGRIEHEVIRRPQRVAAGLGVEILELAGVEVDSLDAPADVVGRRR